MLSEQKNDSQICIFAVNALRRIELISGGKTESRHQAPAIVAQA